jgi:hypothetical protein
LEHPARRRTQSFPRALCRCNVSEWIMADSNAVRSRRKRAHAAGDHSLCRRCDSRNAPVALPPVGDTPVDARVSLEALARRLEAAHVADPGNAVVARELRATLLALPAGETPADDDPLAELRALAQSVP